MDTLVEDINECYRAPCGLRKRTCVNNAGSYKCVCRAGYQDIGTCIDINECEFGLYECDEGTV